MNVQVTDLSGQVIWSHGVSAEGHRTGITSSTYPCDGTLALVLQALEVATDQVKAESLRTDDLDGVANSRTPPSKINSDVPVP